MSKNETSENVNKAAHMTVEEEFEIYLLYKQGKALEEIQEKQLKDDGTQWSIHTLNKLRAKFNKGYVPTVGGDFVYGLGVMMEDDIENFDAERSMSRSFKMATRLLEKALEDAQKGYEIIDESKRQIPIKTIMECIEKAGRFWSLQRKTQKEAGRSGGPVTIDYERMAKLYVKYKKQDDVEYDAGEHMKAVIAKVNSSVQEDDELDEIAAEFEKQDEEQLKKDLKDTEQ